MLISVHQALDFIILFFPSPQILIETFDAFTSSYAHGFLDVVPGGIFFFQLFENPSNGALNVGHKLWLIFRMDQKGSISSPNLILLIIGACFLEPIRLSSWCAGVNHTLNYLIY
jgi:hypothetical protein